MILQLQQTHKTKQNTNAHNANYSIMTVTMAQFHIKQCRDNQRKLHYFITMKEQKHNTADFATV